MAKSIQSQDRLSFSFDYADADAQRHSVVVVEEDSAAGWKQKVIHKKETDVQQHVDDEDSYHLSFGSDGSIPLDLEETDNTAFRCAISTCLNNNNKSNDISNDDNNNINTSQLKSHRHGKFDSVDIFDVDEPSVERIPPQQQYNDNVVIDCKIVGMKERTKFDDVDIFNEVDDRGTQESMKEKKKTETTTTTTTTTTKMKNKFGSIDIYNLDDMINDVTNTNDKGDVRQSDALDNSLDPPSYTFSFGDINDSTTDVSTDKDTSYDRDKSTCGAILNNCTSFEFDFGELDSNTTATTTKTTSTTPSTTPPKPTTSTTSTSKMAAPNVLLDNITPIKKVDKKRYNYDLITGSITKPRKSTKCSMAQTPLRRNNTMPLSLMYQSSLLADDDDPFKSVNKSDETDQQSQSAMGSSPNNKSIAPQDNLHHTSPSQGASNKVTRDGSGTLYCPICQCKPTNGHVSLCGHICCWECWGQWLSIKLECPVCREKTRLKQVKPVVGQT
ncbi:hypothetical protein SAMD00019534_123900 [Acytostelium subglobosum LB1]|uniref:hypothetical protein n=1 Tax=Acytostelium subglobosum LB1 TaxID=1410327 RepID=UPI000644AA0C|nr:hypothetical protein SAMD00019534_123900 [Acytostelium subglobosum LB1]GAM29214.1 hypothetical protein SAMD00019534_123900 [Acytostelium subglobosum LB1]|eukprot:XP_012747905.1 hypothetical protein SAMD00019534_123900 [Acytostelium subglobosum LB1]